MVGMHPTVDHFAKLVNARNRDEQQSKGHNANEENQQNQGSNWLVERAKEAHVEFARGHLDEARNEEKNYAWPKVSIVGLDFPHDVMQITGDFACLLNHSHRIVRTAQRKIIGQLLELDSGNIISHSD